MSHFQRVCPCRSSCVRLRGLAAGLIVVLIGGIGWGEDTVLLKPAGDSGGGRIRGKVLEYTGRELTLQHPSGREETIPSARVETVQTQWDAAFERAEVAWRAHQFEAALADYRIALRAETRSWAKRQIFARIIWCLRNLQQYETACEAFFALYRSDPDTLYIDAIPLAWKPVQPPPALTQQATTWLGDSESPVARLVGASWLISTASRQAALDTLRRFAADDARLIYLAEAQLWRVEIATADAAQVANWQTRIEHMPRAIRGGPYYLLGRAWARQKNHERAALAFLRLPIQFARQRELAAQSLLEAGQQLEALQQAGPAARLYAELRLKYGDTQAAQQAPPQASANSNP